jgi:hypothetical protein
VRERRRSIDDGRDSLIDSGEHEIFRGPIEAGRHRERKERLKTHGEELAGKIGLIVPEHCERRTAIERSFRLSARQTGITARGGAHLAWRDIDMVCPRLRNGIGRRV